MAQLAIRGHATRGKEVIEILKMLGGKNSRNLLGDVSSICYYINSTGKIDYEHYSYFDDDIPFTLEKFLKKFPYKVGDKVIFDGYVACVTSMRWDGIEVVYKVKHDDVLWDTIGIHLQPYKEAPMYLNEKANKKVEEIAEILEPAKEIMEERKYSELRMPLDDDDKLATEATIEGNKITPPENYLIGKITKVDNGMIVEFVKKQPQYPKTYEECCEVISLGEDGKLYTKGYKTSLIQDFQKLIICRDAYWKIAGNWKEKRKEKAMHYVICSTLLGEVVKDTMPNCIANYLLDFPSEEMRDAFFENFKELIELCKELL